MNTFSSRREHRRIELTHDPSSYATEVICRVGQERVRADAVDVLLKQLRREEEKLEAYRAELRGLPDSQLINKLRCRRGFERDLIAEELLERMQRGSE